MPALLWDNICFWCWQRSSSFMPCGCVMAILFMLLLIIAIERLIHTTYTLTTDGRLLLFYGRFSRSEEILLKDIISVERASSMKIGRFAVMRYVLVKYGTKGKCAVLLPVKEDLFIKTLTNRLSEVKKY